MFVVFAVTSGSSLAGCLKPVGAFRADVENPGTEWAEQTLVPRACQDIDRKLTEVNRDMTCRLGGINDDDGTCVTCQCGQVSKWKECSTHV